MANPPTAHPTTASKLTVGDTVIGASWSNKKIARIISKIEPVPNSKTIVVTFSDGMVSRDNPNTKYFEVRE